MDLDFQLPAETSDKPWFYGLIHEEMSVAETTVIACMCIEYTLSQGYLRIAVVIMHHHHASALGNIGYISTKSTV